MALITHQRELFTGLIDMDMNFLSPSTPVKELKEAGENAMKASLAKGMPKGYEVGYDSFTINGRMLGHGDNPGLTLFHCHQQLQMDYGFMSLFDYSG